MGVRFVCDVLCDVVWCVCVLFVFVCVSRVNAFVCFVRDLLCDNVWYVACVVMRLCALCVIDCAMLCGLRFVFDCVNVCVLLCVNVMCL